MSTIHGAQNIQIEPIIEEATLVQIIQLQDQAQQKCREPTEEESLHCMICCISFAQQ